MRIIVNLQALWVLEDAMKHPLARRAIHLLHRTVTLLLGDI